MCFLQQNCGSDYMKTVSVLKTTALLTFAVTLAACSNTPKKNIEPPAPAAALAAPAPAPTAEIVETPRGPSLTLEDVLFDFEQSSLRPEAHHTVEKAANYLQTNPERTALIEGHTDHTGESEFNQSLSVDRSEAIKEALITMGISEDRITTRGLGESSPVADNSTREGRQANRRVEMIFVEQEGSIQ